MWANIILINADAFFLAHIYYLEPILVKITGAISVHKAALSNKVLAHVSTGAPEVPLCLQEALKLLIAFCANGPFVFYQVSGNLGMPGVALPRSLTHMICLQQKTEEQKSRERSFHYSSISTNIAVFTPRNMVYNRSDMHPEINRLSSHFLLSRFKRLLQYRGMITWGEAINNQSAASVETIAASIPA